MEFTPILEFLKVFLLPIILAVYAYNCNRRDAKDKAAKEEAAAKIAAEALIEQARIAAESGDSDRAMKIQTDIIADLREELRETKEERDRYWDLLHPK